VYKKLPVDEHYFSIIDTEEKAYFLGFLFADGCNTGKGLSIQLQHGDVSILHALKGALRSKHAITEIKRGDGRHHVSYGFTSVELSNCLTEWGCVPRKSFVLQFPKALPLDLHRHFIRGFFDGNGYIADVSKSKRKYPNSKISFASTKLFCSCAASIIEKECGVNCKLESTHNEYIWQVIVSGRRQVVKVLKYLYGEAKIALDRKRLIANSILTEKFVDRRYSQKISA